MRNIHIFGGGTVFHVRPHLAISAPAYGTTARRLKSLCEEIFFVGSNYFTYLHLTKMAGVSSFMETNEHIEWKLDDLIGDRETKIIFMSAALCDWKANFIRNWREENRIDGDPGKHGPRLRTQDGDIVIGLTPADKLIRKIRQTRKDIFSVGFKTTTVDEKLPEDIVRASMFDSGLKLLKDSSCNLVLVNDVHHRLNMIVTPEQAAYAVTNDRERVLRELVEMTSKRSRLRFTRSTVTEGNPTSWKDDKDIPSVTRAVVEGFVTRGAYKPFMGKTVGHFAIKLFEDKFLTSMRGTDFNKLPSSGAMVLVVADGDDKVTAVGAKPSVGGQSQRSIFAKLPHTDSIVHAHLQQRPGSLVPKRSQREFECGSHECGENTAAGLAQFGKIWAVMLDNHGPNIVFNSKDVTADEVLKFAEENFYFDRHTSDV